ncbi:MAG: hypothetical protein ACKOCK_04880, partial [Chloroflexota bacterium]
MCGGIFPAVAITSRSALGATMDDRENRRDAGSHAASDRPAASSDAMMDRNFEALLEHANEAIAVVSRDGRRVFVTKS